MKKDELQKRVEEAMLKHHKKKMPRQARKKRNQNPEKETEKEVMSYLKDHGFSCHVVESKAVYSAKAGMYLRGQTVQGFPDVVGCNPNGRAVFIELKAKGKRSTLSGAQWSFLNDKIKLGAFGACVDSAAYLHDLYESWSLDQSAEFLLSELKKPKNI